MWISKQVYNDLHAALEDGRKAVASASSQLERITELTALNRAHYEERLRDKDSLIKSQEARLAVLELERRELTNVLLSREAERNRPSEPITTPDPSDWESIMQAQIAEMTEPDLTATTPVA